jgi:hypothetical protein
MQWDFARKRPAMQVKWGGSKGTADRHHPTSPNKMARVETVAADSNTTHNARERLIQ